MHFMICRRTGVTLLAAIGMLTVAGPSAGDCRLAGRLATSGAVTGMALGNGYAYVAVITLGWGYYASLRVVDVSSPTSPEVVGSVGMGPDEVWSISSGVAVDGNYAHVLVLGVGLQVVDISNATSPAIVGSVAIPGDLERVAVDDSHAYVVNGAGLEVVDISDPTSPVIVGGVSTPGHASDVAVTGSYAYVADGDNGLHVVSTSNPTSPVIVGGTDTPGVATAVAVAGGYAVVADGIPGVQVVDISNPASPAIVGSLVTPAASISVAVFGTHAYVGDVAGGFSVIDISDPTAPAIVDGHYTSGVPARSVLVVPDHIYLGTGQCGCIDDHCGCGGELDVFDRCQAVTGMGFDFTPSMLAIRSASPNPSADGRLRVEFTLRDGSPARLEMVDVAGRTLTVKQVGTLGPGRHVLDLSEGGAVPAGIYFLRLMQGGNQVQARAAVLR